MNELNSPITTIPGMGFRMSAMILAEVGDFSRFDSHICAIPFTSQPKTSSSFAAYLSKKRAEGKHYNVSISHDAKKLVRLILAIQKSGTPYLLAT